MTIMDVPRGEFNGDLVACRNTGTLYRWREREDGSEELTLSDPAGSSEIIYRGCAAPVTFVEPEPVPTIHSWTTPEQVAEWERVRKARKRPTGSSSVVVRFREDAAPTLSVELGYTPLERMADELEHAARGRVESGGFLWSNTSPSSLDRLCVSHVSGPAPDSKHGPERVVLGMPGDVYRTLPDFLKHLVPVGDFHSHPNTSDGRPSTADQRAWAQSLRIHKGRFWVGLIATRSTGPLGWRYPNYSAWVTRSVGGNEFVCEPATIEGR